jgi:lipopolysaccharide/colanic/teichoic acid biosynthesis glycosyltransferase
MWKFRSMVSGADKMVDKLLRHNDVQGAMFKIKNDPRITRIGRVLRKYSLDELPQLYNVSGRGYEFGWTSTTAT